MHRWLNARTIKDAHPLPHQSDCLAALGGNTVFSTMDLTSGLYNLPMHEDDKNILPSQHHWACTNTTECRRVFVTAQHLS